MTHMHAHSRDFLGVRLVFWLAAFLMPIAPAQAVDVSLSAGTGAFVAADKEVHQGFSTDLYPGFGGDLEFSVVRVALKIGASDRKYESSSHGYYCDSYSNPQYTGQYTWAFPPVQFEILLDPMAEGMTIPTISPYFAGMLGAFLPIGDHDEIGPALSLKAGPEINIDPSFICGDVRYTHAPKDGLSFDSVMVLGGLGLRFGS